MKFILDTNFLMIPGQFKVDVYEQLRGFGKPDIYVIRQSVAELEKLAKGRGKDAANARIALLLVKREGVRIIPSGKGGADEAIRRLAKREGMVVCTADKKLKAGLRKRGIPVVSLRERKYLALED